MERVESLILSGHSTREICREENISLGKVSEISQGLLGKQPTIRQFLEFMKKYHKTTGEGFFGFVLDHNLRKEMDEHHLSARDVKL